MNNNKRTNINPEKFAYQMLGTIHFRESSDYESQIKERLTVFLMAKYLIDDFNNLENKAFNVKNNSDLTLSGLGFEDLRKRIDSLNKY